MKYSCAVYLGLDGLRNISTAIRTTLTEIKPTPRRLSIIEAALNPSNAERAAPVPAPLVKLNTPVPVKFLGKPVPLPKVNRVVENPGVVPPLKIRRN
jgi:hypothetical protein